MLIWYFTCNHWWKKAILVPTGMLFYQIAILLNDEMHFKDDLRTDKFFIIPIIVTICIFLFLIRRKLIKKLDKLEFFQKIDARIQEIEKKSS
jgi:hypothetical protein